VNADRIFSEIAELLATEQRRIAGAGQTPIGVHRPDGEIIGGGAGSRSRYPPGGGP
jgi:hypothetical protein